MMKNFHRVYSTVDIITVAMTVYSICAVLRAVVLRDQHSRHHFHLGVLLNSMSRQSVLIVSDAVAHSVHLRDVGTQQEKTLLLVLSTSALDALLTLLPTWFLKDTQQGPSRTFSSTVSPPVIRGSMYPAFMVTLDSACWRMVCCLWSSICETRWVQTRRDHPLR